MDLANPDEDFYTVLSDRLSKTRDGMSSATLFLDIFLFTPLHLYDNFSRELLCTLLLHRRQNNNIVCFNYCSSSAICKEKEKKCWISDPTLRQANNPLSVYVHVNVSFTFDT